MKTEQSYTGLEIAITGISCHFPGATGWRAFWENLVKGVESIEVATDTNGGIGAEGFIKAKASLKNKEYFDYSFFDYSPAEAKLLNPVHRLFHQCVWEALEDAACDPGQLKGSIGLFAGAGDDLNWKVYASLKNRADEVDDFTLHLINNKDYLASLIAYKLNLKGPALVVNTACSTSLVAVSLACKSLLLGECKVALAGGVTVITKKQEGYQYEEGMIYSADGHCRAFDEQASGTISSEGAGVVVLKRLSDAISEGDTIYAVIKGTAVNNDGNQKVGFTAPGVDGQASCIKRAMLFSKVEPESISYIEAHGTGTRLGDPIEIAALNQAFNYNTKHRCAVGSVKTNIGHTDAAAGIAGLIKTALALKFKKIPPSLHYKTANAEINFSDGPFYICNELTDWLREGNRPLRAGVSSFGIGGTNAHAILEEAPVSAPTGKGNPCHLLTLSAAKPDSLLQYTRQLQQFLKEAPDTHPADLAFTLNTGRKNFAYRLPLVYTEVESLQEKLQGISDNPTQLVKAVENRQVIFLFPGQGSQYTGMTRDLYESDDFFREQMDEGFRLLREMTGVIFKEIVFPADTADNRITETRYTQPLLFLVEYIVAQWLIRSGVKPQCMTGHSIGEYVAACISGVFSFTDALRLVVKRGELMNNLPPGAMISIPITAADAAKYITTDTAIAAINAPKQVVIAGTIPAIEKITEQLRQDDIECIRLHTSHAFHSPVQDSILNHYLSEVKKVHLHEPRLPFISNLTGKMIEPSEAMSPEYWVQHLRHTVQFSEGIQTILSGGSAHLFIEAGPGHSLSGLVKQQPGSAPSLCVNMLRTVRNTTNDTVYWWNALGQIWANGIQPDWKKIYEGQNRKKISLPVYCFEQVKHATEVDPAELLSANGTVKKQERGTVRDWLYYPTWKRTQLPAAHQQDEGASVLFFCSGNKISVAIREELESEGKRVLVIQAGKQCAKIADLRYIADPSATEEFELLLDTILDRSFTTIVYAWGMLASDARMQAEEKNRDFQYVFLAPVRCMQRIIAKTSLKDLAVYFLTDRLHVVTGSEPVSPVQSLLLGLLNVLPQEYGVYACNIDTGNKTFSKDAAVQICKEINGDRNRDERIIAYRNGQRWVRDYAHSRELAIAQPQPLKKGGVYLITGGLGDVGYIVANHLLKKYDAKLVLTGRRAVEQQGSMVPIASLVLTLKEEGRKRLAELQEQSTNVRYYAADVSNPSEMKAVVADAERQFGQIDGVVHTAGLVDHAYFEMVEDMSPDNIRALLVPKINGIRTLYEIFGDRKTDFVWITSSIASELGGLGYGAYSAGNLYMDYFLQSKAAELPQWKCVGLAELSFSEGDYAGTNALNPGEIAALLEYTCGATFNPVLYETIEDLHERTRKTFSIKTDHFQEEEISTDETGRIERPLLSADYRDAATETQRRVQHLFSGLFGISTVGIEDDFYELGGDSLKAMVLLKRIQKEFSVRITLAEFMSKRNIREVADCIDEIATLLTETTTASTKKILI